MAAAAMDADLTDLRRFEAAFKGFLGKLGAHNKTSYEQHRGLGTGTGVCMIVRNLQVCRYIVGMLWLRTR